MRRCLVIQHSYAEFLGGFERLLEDRHIGFSYCRPFVGDPLPTTALHHDALWVLSGPGVIDAPQSAAYGAELLRLIGAFRRAQRPVIGLGSGALWVALHAGGAVEHAARGYTGFVEARVTPNGRDDPVARVIDGATVLTMHTGGVRLAATIEPLAVSPSGQWLIARPDPSTYALLPRFEMRPGMLEDMAMEDGRALPDDIGALIEATRQRSPASDALAQRVVAALVVTLDLMRERTKPAIIPVRVVKG